MMIIDYCFIPFCKTNFVISYLYSIYLFILIHLSIQILFTLYIEEDKKREKIV